jgi:hypothetical protein
MTTIENGHRVQTASEGMILTNGENYSKTVYLGEGMPEWQEVPESQMPQPPVIDVEHEVVN